jgi:hypothetical protein
MGIIEPSDGADEEGGGVAGTLALDELIPDPAQREVILRVQRELFTRSSNPEDI